MKIQNTGFTKTLFQKDGHYSNNEMKWESNYDGKIADIDIDINDNGNNKHVSMKLDNKDLAHLLGIQPVNIPLEERLMNDFFPYSQKKITANSRKSHSRKSHSRKSRSPFRKSRKLRKLRSYSKKTYQI